MSGLIKTPVMINGKFDYESHHFKIPQSWKEFKWTKTRIKQMLAYFGLANSQGDMGAVDLEELSELLHCSIRSLRNNNKEFVKMGWIKVEPIYGDYFHIQMVDYLEQFLDLRKQASSGYTTIKREALFELFKVENVNVLRLACRTLYMHEKEVNTGNHEFVLMDSKTIKKFLPTYFTYQPVIQKYVKKHLTGLFGVEFYSSDSKEKLWDKNHRKENPSFLEKMKSNYLLSMKLHHRMDSRAVTKEEFSDYWDWGYLIREFHHAVNVNPVSTQTIGELVHEYGDEPVRLAMENIISIHKKKEKDISRAAVDCYQDILKLKFHDQPIGILRKIFKKFALTFQEDYLALS